MRPARQSLRASSNSSNRPERFGPASRATDRRKRVPAMNHVKLLIDGDWIEAKATEPVLDKYTGQEIARMSVADEAQTLAAVRAARKALLGGTLHPYRRYEILVAAAARLREREEEVLPTLPGETGF